MYTLTFVFALHYPGLHYNKVKQLNVLKHIVILFVLIEGRKENKGRKKDRRKKRKKEKRKKNRKKGKKTIREK